MTPIANRAWGWVSPDVQPLVLGFLVLVSLIVFMGAVWPKLKVLCLAASEDRFDRPFQRLKNVFKVALAQTKILKETLPGWMHALIFWGFCVLLFRAAQFFAIGFFPGWPPPPPELNLFWNAYLVLKDAFVLLVTAAVIFGLYRRIVLKPRRLTLSLEGILILVLILVIMATDVMFEAAFVALHPEAGSWWSPLGLMAALSVLPGLAPAALQCLHDLAYWGHVGAILLFFNLIPRSKHFHIITSFPNVYFSNVAGRGNQLERIDFEDETREDFGVIRIEEFSWKRLLDLHTCTECGRCDTVCPALASGKPLSPKEFTVDLRDHLNAMTPALLDLKNSGDV